MCCIENHASPAFSEWSETKLSGMEKRRGRGQKRKTHLLDMSLEKDSGASYSFVEALSFSTVQSCLPGVFGMERNEVERNGETQGAGAK